MFKNFFSITVLFAFLISCKSNHEAYIKFLNKDSLPSQFIEVDNSRDTSITTANGAILKIEKGSFSKEKVKLQLKEAYSIEQMILAGLTTESNEKPLSSGGMIYIGSDDKNLKVNKPISVSIPTNYYDNKMKVYRGEEENGKLNWTDPQPLTTQDSLPSYLQEGKLLFQQNCASCHTLDKDLTGPALSGVEGRGPWTKRSRLLAYTKNPPVFTAHNCYVRNLKNQYGTMMTAFPQLDANAIYDYIRNEDYKKGIIYSNSYNSLCGDSCWQYDSLYYEINKITSTLNNQMQALIDSNGERINFERTFSEDSSFIDSTGYIVQTFSNIDKVEPVKYKAVYYQFDIKSFDWYNVDFPVKPAESQAGLKVEMQGEYKKEMSVFIVVPQYRIFAEGGPLKDEENTFGFYTRDGKISMPPGLDVTVFAVGEIDGQITFDYKKFISTDKQRIILKPKIVSKKEFNKAVKKFKLRDVSIKAEDSKNADVIRKMDKIIKSNQDLLELYRPKNCDCNCGESDASSKLIRIDSLMK